jgi:O-antigen ligase
MKAIFTRSTTLSNWLVAIVLVGVPFQGFLTVWGSTLVGHYTALRLWDDVLLLILASIVCGWLAKDAPLRRELGSSLLVRLILAYAGLTLLLGIVSLAKGEVTAKALGYGLLVNLRFLAWFVAVLAAARRSSWLREHWQRLVLWPAAIVATFAALQFTVLPHNFLTHFGYDATTNIAPIETINHNSRYIRVQSTTRGANPLGAYLVIVIATLAVLFAAAKRRWVWAAAGLVALLALYATGSRSAWIGVLLALIFIAWRQLESRRLRMLFGGGVVLVLLLFGGAALLLRNNVSLQNALLHTQQHSKSATGSNSAHASALKNGLTDVLHQPLGDGPGTAGPASEYNSGHPARIAENYYVQIAQETGWLGGVLFISILVLTGRELYRQVHGSRLALMVFAAFIGIAFVNLLSHAWADDTLAFVWWGLAAITLAGLPTKSGVTDA